MQFVYPNFLWALLFVAVPIIIHLFYFRRYKKVLFSNVSFLNEVKDERATKNKLKHLLVLLTRILAIIFLVLAFAQPFFAKENQAVKTTKNISIYIDNSFSMEAEGNGQLLIDEAKEVAQGIINSFASNDLSDENNYQVLTNDFEGKHQRLVNKTEAQSLIKDIKISAASRSIKSVYDRQLTIFKKVEEENIIYQVSDYQINSALFSNDSNITTNIVKLSPAEIRNIYIDTVWFDKSFQLKDATNKMIVRFVNESNEAVSGNYQMLLNNETKSVGTYEIEKNASFIDTIVFKISEIGWNTGKIQLSDYPIIFDDHYFFSFYVEESVKVLNISESEADDVFKAVFKGIENIDYTSVKYTLVDYNKLTEKHFIILDRIKTLPSGLVESLKKYIENGGNIFIVPNKDASLASYNRFLSSLGIGSFAGSNDAKRQVSDLNLKHYVLNDLFEKTPNKIKLPLVNRSFVLNTKINSNEEQIMSFRNNDTYLSSFSLSKGNIYLLASSLETAVSDVKANALFAPMVYKMAVLSVNNSQLAFEINANTQIAIKRKTDYNIEDLIKVKSEDNNGFDAEYIPQKSLFGGLLKLNIINTNIKAGIYDVNNDKQETSLISKIALNYNRSESDLKYYTEEDLKNAYPEGNVSIFSGNLNSIKENITNIQDGKPLWKWFIIISLLFLAFEIVLLRILK